MRKLKTEPNIKNRAIATIIDYIIFFTIWIIYIYSFGEPNNEGGLTVSGMKALPLFASWFIYFPIIESIKGQTAGHLAAGIKVIDQSGNSIDLVQALKRRVMDPIDLIAFFGLIAFITVKNSENNQRIGDMFAGTIVVGGEHVVCHYCGEKLKLLPEEKIRGIFLCPTCGKENQSM